MGIRRGYLAGADIVGMGSKGDDFGLGGDVPKLDGGVVGAREDVGGREGGEFGDMDGLLVGIKGAEDGTGADVEHLGWISGGRRGRGTRTWTRPVSSPATRSFPSWRRWALRATSLNLDMVLTTFCVRGA